MSSMCAFVADYDLLKIWDVAAVATAVYIYDYTHFGASPELIKKLHHIAQCMFIGIISALGMRVAGAAAMIQARVIVDIDGVKRIFSLVYRIG